MRFLLTWLVVAWAVGFAFAAVTGNNPYDADVGPSASSSEEAGRYAAVALVGTFVSLVIGLILTVVPAIVILVRRRVRRRRPRSAA